MRLLRNLSRWLGTPLTAVVATVVAVVLAAMSAVPAGAAGPAVAAGPAADTPPPFTDGGRTDAWDLGADESASARRSSPPAEGAGGFLYRRDGFAPLAAVPGAQWQIHHAINDRGDTAGLFLDADVVAGPDGFPPDAFHGFVKDRRGQVTTFDVPGGANTFPQGINDRGQIAGIFLSDGGIQTGFLRDRNGRTTTIDLSAIGTKARDVNDRGQVVGIYGEPADNEVGYVVRSYWRDPDGTITTIAVPGAGETSVYGIDDRGRVVGTYTDAGVTPAPDGSVPSGTLHGFILDGGRLTRLDAPGAVVTQAADINERGQVVGAFIDTTGIQHGFLYDDGRYTTIDAPRPLDPFAMGSVATGINDRGEVVVPEPLIKLNPPREPS
jgi:probable HAF family extracellular repeat protein